MEYIPHPWNEKSRKKGIEAWCLVKRVKPEHGPVLAEPVAIFNYNSEAEIFMGHVFAEKLNGKLVSISDDMADMFEIQLKWRREREEREKQ
jgi:hypothetical protein